MMVEASIPRHITGIYVFAVVNLLALLCISGADADIIVKNLTSNETIQFDDLQAGFGPDFPDEGIEGYIVYANPPDACTKVKPPPYHLENHKWILLIARGGSCQFADKVLNAQLQFYDAAIIHNYNHKGGGVHMGGGDNGSYVRIPSTFVGWNTGYLLKTKYNYTNPNFIVKIVEGDGLDIRMYLWPFAIVVAICFLMVMIFLLVKFLRDHAHRRVSRLSKKHLKKIPVRKYKKGDYYDTCAICLDEYEEGEKIRVLPCDHVYHTKCIDPWLTKNKKTCPVCKRRVIPGKDADSESGSDSEDGGTTAATSGSENTPLLTESRPSYTNRPRGSLRVVGNDTSDTRPQTENEAMEGIGTAVLTTLDEYGAIYPSDSDTEPGAVGGVGISDRRSRRQAPSTSGDVSNQGNIQGDAQGVEAQEEKKKKSHKRERRARQERQEDEAQAEDENAPLVTETREERRERRKKKKEKKRRSERSSRSQENGNGQAKSTTGEEEKANGAARRENKDDEFDTSTSTLKASENEEKAEGGNDNPSFSGGQEVILPRSGRRREMNELV